jgi:Spy/CpxP family protein refolding chaperone
LEKKTMRGTWIKTSLLMLGMSLAGAGLQAQQAPAATTSANQEAMQSGSASQDAATLKLSPEQKKQLHELRLSARDQAAIIRNDQTLSGEQKQSKLKELRASTRDQMKSILTPDQQKAFAERHAARKAKIVAELGLTPEQQSKLKGLFQSTRQQRQQVLTNASLSNEQKLAQLKQIRQDAKSQLATILSPDQLQKFRELRKHRGMMMHKQG